MPLNKTAKLYKLLWAFCFVLTVLTSCEKNTSDERNTNDSLETEATNLKLLSLGDSYTIGESVCNACRFPEQLKDSLLNRLNSEISINLNVIATTGWTTTDLLNALDNEDLDTDHDLVTLLIGVNNQYQNQPFNIYETEFEALVQRATTYAGGDKDNIIVVSIPDYGYTPFGQSNQENISLEIEQYNAFARTYCEVNNITFVNITDITQRGLEQPNLVASDNLHPSTLAYSLFVERLLPKALAKLQN